MSELALFKNAGAPRPARILWPGGSLGDPAAMETWGKQGSEAIHSASGNVQVKNGYQIVLLDDKPFWVALQGKKVSFRSTRLLATSEFAYFNPGLQRVACAGCWESSDESSFYALAGEWGATDVYSASCVADTVVSERPAIDFSAVGGMYGQWQVWHYAMCLSTPGGAQVSAGGVAAYSLDMRKDPKFLRAAAQVVDRRVFGEFYQMYYSDSPRMATFYQGHPDYIATTPFAGLHYYPSSMQSAAYAIRADQGYTGVAMGGPEPKTREFMYEGRPDGYLTLRETVQVSISSVHHGVGPVGTIITYRKENS